MSNSKRTNSVIVNFCNGCEEIIDIKEESLESHLLQFHDGDSNVSLKSYFGDILLVPGPGYMEKNFLHHHLQVCEGYFHV